MENVDGIVFILSWIFFIGTMITYVVLAESYPKNTIDSTMLMITKIWVGIFVAIFSLLGWIWLFSRIFL